MNRNWLLACWLCLLASAAWGRTWTDRTGQYTVEAEFVKVEAGNVYLKKADGRIINVPLTRLSIADAIHVAEIVNEQQRPKRLSRAGVLAALDQPTEFDFVNTPLYEVLEYLEDLHHINIEVDVRCLDGVGVGSDQSVTLTAKGKLRDLLDRILDQEQLT